MHACVCVCECKPLQSSPLIAPPPAGWPRSGCIDNSLLLMSCAFSIPPDRSSRNHICTRERRYVNIKFDLILIINSTDIKWIICIFCFTVDSAANSFSSCIHILILIWSISTLNYWSFLWFCNHVLYQICVSKMKHMQLHHRRIVRKKINSWSRALTPWWINANPALKKKKRTFLLQFETVILFISNKERPFLTQ